MKDAPTIVAPAGWPEIFCTALASRQHCAISPARRADRSSPAFIFFTLTTFPLATAIELLSIEPFSERHAHICTGELPIQFYGNAAERTYSAPAALLF
jgi:hypothetical protein